MVIVIILFVVGLHRRIRSNNSMRRLEIEEILGKKTKYGRSNSKSKQLNSFIRTSLAKGHSKKDIKKELIKAGWPKDLVRNRLKKVK